MEWSPLAVPEPLDLEWDPAKSALNAEQRGLPFDLAWALLADPAALMVPDPEHSATEARWRVYGRVTLDVGPRLLLAVITIRGTRVRVISLRRCKRKEANEYEQHRSLAPG